jgi:hypothetical protein
MPVVTKFVSYCPLGHVCGKGYRRLGSHMSEEEAREKVKWHLTSSANHGDILEEEAQQRANDMELETEEVDVPDEAARPAGKEASKGSGWGKGHGGGKRHGKGKWNWDQADSSRFEPYQVALPPRPQPTIDLTAPIAECIEALTRSESSARAASRVARQAAVAFDDEASILHMTLEKLQACVQAMDTMSRR